MTKVLPLILGVPSNMDLPSNMWSFRNLPSKWSVDFVLPAVLGIAFCILLDGFLQMNNSIEALSLEVWIFMLFFKGLGDTKNLLEGVSAPQFLPDL